MRLPWAAWRRMAVVVGFVVAGQLASLWCAVQAEAQDIGAPGRPTEGTKRDRAFDGDGTYRVFWTPPSGEWPSVTYEYQERAGTVGEWVSLQVGTKAMSRTVPGRQHAVQYFYRVRARSAGGPWGPWSETSSGIVVDTTRPAPVGVSDDGESTGGAPRLHASWTPSADSESGVQGYELIVREESPTGPVVLTFQSVGLVLETTIENLLLSDGKAYFIGVRAVNGAGRTSSVSYADGIAFTGPGPSRVTIDGRRILLERRLADGTLAPPVVFEARGVFYSPAGRDTITSPQDPNNADVRREEFGKWFATDVPIIGDLGATVVRLPMDPGVDAILGPVGRRMLDEFHRRGIMVVITVDDGINDLARVEQAVSYYKDHPSILAWSLGSEFNINRYFGVASSALDAAERTERAAVLIKTLDPRHPVFASYGDIDIDATGLRLADTQHYVNDVCPSVDGWMLNLYRGNNFDAAYRGATVFDQWAAISTKPMLVGEYGTDAFRTTAYAAPPVGVEDEQAQRDWNLALWDEILRHSSARSAAGVAAGGFSFSFTDEHWEVSPPTSQDTGGWLSAGFPDGVGNEEWFGGCDIDRRCRLVFGALRAAFDPGYMPSEPMSFSASSQGTCGYARFWRGSVPFYSDTGCKTNGARGFNVAAMDGATGRWLGPVERFDTWLARNTGTEMNRLVDYLEALPDGAIVLVAVADEAGLNVDLSCTLLPYPWVERALQAFEALGSTQIRSGSCFRSSWSLIAVKGERNQDGSARARAEALSLTSEALSQAAVELR